MKKILLLAILLSTAFVSKAQLTWDVRAGVNVSGIENSDSKMRLGMRFGAGVDYAFSNLISVRPMLYYSSKGTTKGSNNLGFSPNEVLKLNYMEMPVLASFHFKLSDKYSLVANAGPYFAYLLNQSPSNTIIKYKKFDAGLNMGVDFVVQKFVIGVEAQYGMANLSSNADKLRNINYSLMLGYKF